MVARIVLTILVAAFLANAAHAVITIKITESTEAKQAIAIVPFGWQHGRADPPPADIASIVADDLARTGQYEPVPFDGLPSRPIRHEQINFKDWRLLGTNDLVIGNVTPGLDGQYVVEFQLYDVLRRKQVIGYQLTASKRLMRRVAHQIADEIYKELTGVRGAFDTRVAYVTEVAEADGSARYALAVSDVDGHNEHIIPRFAPTGHVAFWSPDGSKLAYVSFESDQPNIFIQDIATGERERIASFPGINGAPAFSPTDSISR